MTELSTVPSTLTKTISPKKDSSRLIGLFHNQSPAAIADTGLPSMQPFRRKPQTALQSAPCIGFLPAEPMLMKEFLEL